MNNPTNAYPTDEDIEKEGIRHADYPGAFADVKTCKNVMFKLGAKYAREKTKAYYENEIKHLDDSRAIERTLMEAISNVATISYWGKDRSAEQRLELIIKDLKQALDQCKELGGKND